MAKSKKPRAPHSGRWVCKWVIIHWRSKKPMRRRDGKPFRFRIG